MKKLLLVLIVLIAGYQLAQRGGSLPVPTGSAPTGASERTANARIQVSDALAGAIANRQSSVQVDGRGTVEKILPDDNQGARHQRFIVRIDNSHTILIAHNIDLAPRVEALRGGDEVEFRGEYEWNARGGVIHWTHRDPQGRHEGGWIRHQGRSYQ